mmetsp:Transcript_7320/g.16768  ORF Transcript_7320/g.16768 Transcript_7320/m.16768 type:complete len:617 (-) Transcript_7320:975-2825(-)
MSLATLLPTIPMLTALQCGTNHFGDLAASSLSSNVTTHPSLTFLDVSNNQLGVRASTAMAKMLRENKNISELDISWNNFGSTGCAQVLDAMGTNSKVESFNLSWNGCGVEGSEALVNCLKANSTLTKIDLANCRISPGATRALGEALEKNHTITCIRLDWNSLGADSRFLNKVLKDHKSIETFSMHNCCGETQDQPEFDELNPSGHYILDLANPKDRKIAQRLAEMGAAHQGENWRNEHLDGVRFVYPRDYMWGTPSAGRLEFDFVQLDPCEEEPLGKETYDKLMSGMRKNLTDSGKMVLLRNACTAHYYDSLQALGLVQSLSFDKSREQACVTLFSRICDRQNAAQMLMHALGDSSRRAVQRRLGALQIFNRGNPTGYYHLDLNKRGDHEVLRILFNCGVTTLDRGFQNIRYNGSTYHLQDLASVPQTGTLVFDFTLPRKEAADDLHRVMAAVIETMHLQQDGEAQPNKSWNPFHNRPAPQPISSVRTMDDKGDRRDKDRDGFVAQKGTFVEERRSFSRASSRSGDMSPSGRSSRPQSGRSERKVTGATHSRISRRPSEDLSDAEVEVLMAGPPVQGIVNVSRGASRQGSRPGSVMSARSAKSGRSGGSQDPMSP